MEATGPTNYDNIIRQCILQQFPHFDPGNTGYVQSIYFPQIVQNILTKIGQWQPTTNEQMSIWMLEADRNEDDKLTKMELFCFLSNLMKKKGMGLPIYNVPPIATYPEDNRTRGNSSGHGQSVSLEGQPINMRKSVHNDYITSHSGQLLPVQYPQEEVYEEPQTISQLIKTQPTPRDLYLKNIIDQTFERYDTQHRFYLTFEQLPPFLNECFSILKLPNRITPDVAGFTFQYTDLNRDGVIQKMQVFLLLRELMDTQSYPQ